MGFFFITAVFCCPCFSGYRIAFSAKRRPRSMIDNTFHILFQFCCFFRSHKRFVYLRNIFLNCRSCIIFGMINQIWFHQCPSICNCSRNKRHMVRTNLCFSLTNCCHHNFTVCCVFVHTKFALAVRQYRRKLFIKQQLFCRFSVRFFIQHQTNIRIRCVTGVGKRIR